MKFKDIASHEIACKVLGKETQESTNIHDQLDDIADAINKLDGDYRADFSNSEQKWRPYFVIDASGFRFGGSSYDYSGSYADVGSRLCQYFRSKEVADFYGTHFVGMHEKCFRRSRPKQGAPKSFTDIKSHSDACMVIDKDPAQSTTPDQMITDICRAMNKLSGFKPDFNNDRPKWRPFFRMDASGFRFAYSRYDFSYSYSDVGSRLCHFVGSEAEADHLGKQFFELHKERYLGE